MLNFTLTDLRYLIALADEQHFAKAAQKCFVSQPTLSIAIRKLEDNLGITIFERENHKVIITSAGQEIIHQARKIIAESYQLMEMVESNQNPFKQPLKIGAILTIGPYLFPSLIQSVLHSMPSLQLVIEESYTDTLIGKLLEGNIDIIILATEVNHSELKQINIFEDKLNLICSQKHKFAKLSKVTAKQMENETFLLLGTGNCFRDQVLQICPQCNTTNSQFASMITASSLETIKYMVAMDIGISIIPKLAQKHLPSEVVVKHLGEKQPSRTISVVYRKNFAREKLAIDLVNLLKNQYANQDLTTH